MGLNSCFTTCKINYLRQVASSLHARVYSSVKWRWQEPYFIKFKKSALTMIGMWSVLNMWALGLEFLICWALNCKENVLGQIGYQIMRLHPCCILKASSPLPPQSRWLLLGLPLCFVLIWFCSTFYLLVYSIGLDVVWGYGVLFLVTP